MTTKTTTTNFSSARFYARVCAGVLITAAVSSAAYMPAHAEDLIRDYATSSNASPDAAFVTAEPAPAGSSLPRVTVNRGNQRVAQPRSAASIIKEPVTPADCKSGYSAARPYFVEFRSRTAASYGHTFMMHGRLASRDHYAQFEIAGLHPAGDSSLVYMMGHLMPVAAETGASDGDLDEQYMTARYCVTLTEGEYRRVEAYIRKQQATSPVWNAMTWNCNAFAGDVAKFMGLQAPMVVIQIPEDFINNMREMNSGRRQLAGLPGGVAPAPLATRVSRSASVSAPVTAQIYSRPE